MIREGLTTLLATLLSCASVSKPNVLEAKAQAPVTKRRSAMPRGMCSISADVIVSGPLMYYACDVDGDKQIDELILDPPVTDCKDGKYVRANKIPGSCYFSEEQWTKYQKNVDEKKEIYEVR